MVTESIVQSTTIIAWMQRSEAAVSEHSGDMTLLDSMDPATDALRRAVEAERPLPLALSAAAEAAEEGMRATIPMQARKGRASYLGERSIGHQDPGATSTALIIRALESAA